MASNYMKARAKELRDKNEGGAFNANYAKASNVQLIANRFTNHKGTDVESIKSIEKIIQYMIASKLVGDRKLYTKLNEYTDGVFDKFCEDIEIQDDCHDGFERAVDRHLYRFNKDVYNYLHDKRIKFVDAGLVKYGGRDIFLPAYNTLINVVNNRRCLEELDEFIKNTPEEDKHNENFSWEPKVVKKFIVYDHKLYVSNRDSDPVDLRDTMVTEYICDSQLDPDDIIMSKFEHDIADGRGNITLHRNIPFNKLKNYDEIAVRNGVVYHDEHNHVYKIVGHYELMHLLRYDELNSTSLVFVYTGANNEALVNKTKLGKLNRYYEPLKFDEAEEEYGEGTFKNNMLYLFKGTGKLCEQSRKVNDNEVTFDVIKEMLDKLE